MSTSTANGFSRVKELARGRWSQVISDLYPSFSGALTKAMSRPGMARCACPIHPTNKGAKADGFRVYRDFEATGGAVCNTCGSFATGIDLICFLEGQEGNPLAALKLLEKYFGLDQNGSSKPRDLPERIDLAPAYDERTDPKAIKRRLEVMASIWGSSVPLNELADDHQAIVYLRETRGLDDLEIVHAQSNMRFNNELYYSRSEIEGDPPICFPGIVSMMHGADGQPVGLHRIFLDPDKPVKANVEKPKKILARLEKILNGSVRVNGLLPFSSHANVAEGVETSLAISRCTGHSAYAATYATLLAAWQPPAGVRFVTIWADREISGAGILNAQHLQKRLIEDGLQCRILVPEFSESDSEDWNDVLLKNGSDALFEAFEGRSAHTKTL